MNKCIICGGYLDTSGHCPNMCEIWKDEGDYNFKCPECKGEFNDPSFISAPGGTVTGYYQCPFCGRIILGI